MGIWSKDLPNERRKTGYVKRIQGRPGERGPRGRRKNKGVIIQIVYFFLFLVRLSGLC